MRGVLIERYKRFLADVRLDDGSVVTAHTANPGGMRGMADPGTEVYLSRSDDPRRKLAHSWELARYLGRLAGVNPLRSNAIVAEGIARGRTALPANAIVEREVTVPGGRMDLCLRSDEASIYVEVKTATWVKGRTVYFPDAPSARAVRHVEALRELRRSGARAVICYLVQRSDVDEVVAAREVDPDYAAALARSRREGVEVMAYRCRITRRGIWLADRLSCPR